MFFYSGPGICTRDRELVSHKPNLGPVSWQFRGQFLLFFHKMEGESDYYLSILAQIIVSSVEKLWNDILRHMGCRTV